MNKHITEIPINERILVDLHGLMQLCSCGRVAAEKIGNEAGAVIRVGRRRLYNIEKIKVYINSIDELEVQQDDELPFK